MQNDQTKDIKTGKDLTDEQKQVLLYEYPSIEHIEALPYYEALRVYQDISDDIETGHIEAQLARQNPEQYDY